MAEPPSTVLLPAPVVPDALQDALEALRQAGAAAVDPVRLRYLEALARRIAQAPAAVAPVLGARWQSACDALQARCRPPTLPAAAGSAAPPAAGLARLAALNAQLRAAAGSTAAAAAAPDGLPPDDPTELRSLRAFRETWSRIAALDRVDAAVTRGPENAGPLNSHALVLRSLALMRRLSPDYLRRYLSHMESLMVLEQMQHAPRATAARTRAKARAPARKMPG